MSSRDPHRTHVPRFSSTLKFVLLLAGASLVVAGLAAITVGGVTLVRDAQQVRLTEVSGPQVPIPASSGLFGGSVMVFTEAPSSDSPRESGCELVEADGDVASGTRIGAFDFALEDPVTVDGTTWYPFTQVELGPRPATLGCADGTLATAALSEQSTFGRMSTFIGVFALGSGVVALVMGVPALIVGGTIRAATQET